LNITICAAEENSKADEPKSAEPPKKAEEAPQKTEDPPQVSIQLDLYPILKGRIALNLIRFIQCTPKLCLVLITATLTFVLRQN